MLEVKIALLVKNTNRYWSLITGTKYPNAIKGIKEAIDIYSQFLIIPLNDNQIAMQSENGKYLSRILQGHNKSFIQAVKDEIDIYSKFTVNYEAENLITLKADNGEYLHSGDDTFIQTKSNLEDSCRFYISTIFS